jgi:hypothetical protein
MEIADFRYSMKGPPFSAFCVTSVIDYGLGFWQYFQEIRTGSSTYAYSLLPAISADGTDAGD